MTSLPDSYSYGVQAWFNRSTAFWAHRSALNIANLKFNFAIKDIKAAQDKWETTAEALRDKIDADWVAGKITVDQMTDLYKAHAANVVQAFWDLSDNLIWKDSDGYLNEPGNIGQDIGYPAWWLKQVGYPNGPPKPPHRSGATRAVVLPNGTVRYADGEGAVAPVPPGLRMV